MYLRGVLVPCIYSQVRWELPEVTQVFVVVGDVFPAQLISLILLILIIIRWELVLVADKLITWNYVSNYYHLNTAIVCVFRPQPLSTNFVWTIVFFFTLRWITCICRPQCLFTNFVTFTVLFAVLRERKNNRSSLSVVHNCDHHQLQPQPKKKKKKRSLYLSSAAFFSADYITSLFCLLFSEN